MSDSWSLSERWEQLWGWVRQAGVSGSHRMAPRFALLAGLTMAITLLSLVFESFALFLVAVVQAWAIFPLRSGSVHSGSMAAEPFDSQLMEGLRRQMPPFGEVYRVSRRFATMAYRLVYRATMCLLISLSAGLAVLSAFVLQQPEFWQWATLQESGPPLGPVLAAGFVMLTVALVTGWLASRWPLLPC